MRALIGIAIALALVGQLTEAGLFSIFTCGPKCSDAYVELNDFLVAKVAVDDLAANAAIAREFANEIKLDERQQANSDDKNKNKKKSKRSIEFEELVKALGQIDTNYFDDVCDSENLNGLRKLVESREQVRNAKRAAARLDGLVDAYLAEVYPKCYKQLVTSWPPSDLVFDELFGQKLAPIDRLLAPNMKLAYASKYEEPLKLDVAVKLVKASKSPEKLFKANDFKQLVQELYEHSFPRGPQPDKLSDGALATFLNNHLMGECQTFGDRPDTMTVLRPLVDLVAITPGGLSDSWLDGWFQDGRDGNHALVWAARLALCSLVQPMNPDALAKTIRKA